MPTVAQVVLAAPSELPPMKDFLLRDLGLVDYASSYAAMQSFSAQRDAATPDEIWFCQHPPVFTQGLAGKAEHLLGAGDIPVVQSNRGGQVTYHGPGQIVAYPLIDLQLRGYFVKEFVYKLEESLIRTLAEFGLTGHRVRGAPGVYVRRSDPSGHARLSELENSIERAVALCEGSQVMAHDLPPQLREKRREDIVSFALSRNMTLEELEREYILRVMKEESGNKTPEACGFGDYSQT